MATQVRARMGSASGVVGTQKCWGYPRHRFAPSTHCGRVVDAHRRRGLDFYGQIPLWPPKYVHEWAVQAAWSGCKNVGRTPAVGLHTPHPVFASWTHTVGVVWTSMAIYFYGHPSTRTNGPCKWRGWDAQTLGGCPAVGLHPAHPVVASRTHTVGVVWTSMAIYVYGHPSTRTNGQCKWRGRDAKMLGGRPPSVCTLHTLWSRRGRTP